MDILLYQEQSPSVFRCLRQSKEQTQRVYFNWKYRWYHLTNFGSTVNTSVNGRPWITNPFLVNLDLDSSDFSLMNPKKGFIHR